MSADLATLFNAVDRGRLSRRQLLRTRHRYLSVREFDRAFADLTRGAFDSTIYGIWYHLGVVQYLRGDFAEAAASFAKPQPIAPDAGELAGSTDWLWMSLSRAGRGADAKAMLDRRPDSKPVTTRARGACSSIVARLVRKPCSRRRIPTTCRSPRSPTVLAIGTSCGATRRRRACGSSDRSSRAVGPGSDSSCRRWSSDGFVEIVRQQLPGSVNPSALIITEGTVQVSLRSGPPPS
jgi:hypothetical protein